MATVKAIKYGMKGDEVKNLQTTLNNLGYNLDVDGSFGPQTLSAVKDYQKKNGLTVDGMVGPQTQGKLFGGSSGTATNTSAAATSGNATNTKPATTTPTTTTPTVTTPSANTPTVNTSESGNKNTGFTYDPYQSSGAVNNAVGDGFSYDDFTYDKYQSSGAVDKAVGDGFSYDDFSYGDYQQSESVTQAQAALNAALAAQPGAYQSKWQDQINSMIDRILNRESFSYNYNEDALYKQYAEQYARGGKLAMQDTMGQAAAMTGGYGSSYASTAGNQAYQEYMSQLNEVIPELYGMALNRYQMEGQEMYNRYGLLSDQEQQDYGRYQDSYNQWLAERDYAAGRYDSERNFDYGKYTDDRNFSYGVYADDKNYAYSDYRNNIEDAKWQEQQEYAQYSDDRNFNYGVYADDKSYDYNDYRATIEDAKWQEETEYKQYLDKLGIAYDEHMNAYELEQLAKDNAYRDKVYADSLTQQGIENDRADRELGMKEEAWEVEKSTIADSTKSYSGNGFNNGTLTNGQIKELQSVLGVEADGKFGPKSKEAAGGLSADEAYAKYVGSTSATSTFKGLTASEAKGVASQIAEYADSEDLEGAEAYLTYLVANEYITEDEAKSFLAPYVKVEEDEVVDTTVDTYTGSNTIPPLTTGTDYPILISPEEAAAFKNGTLTPEELMKLWKEKGQFSGMTPEQWVKTLK